MSRTSKSEVPFCCRCGEDGHYYFEHFTLEQEMKAIFGFEKVKSE